MSGWPSKSFREIFRLKQGKYLPKDEMVEAPRGDWNVPVYGANGVIGYSNRVMYDRPVPLVSCRGANCGVTHLTQPRSWVSNNSIACVSDEVDARFYYHVFRITSFSDVTGGSAQPQITLTSLGPKLVVCPPLKTQRRIASILGAYDHLIDVNRRRVAVLEEMARGMFDEWFVRFRFPGHEAVPMVDTLNGPLPQGWAMRSVGDTFDLLGGGTPSKTVAEYWDGGTVNWYTPTDLTAARSLFMDQSALRITEKGLAKSSAKLFPSNSVMMTSRATIGAISICTGPACTNQGFITCLPNEDVSRSYLYYWLTQNVPIFIAHATGATFKEITKGVFKRLPICVPDRSTADCFDDRVRPMHDMILAIERSNRRLASSRDLLLPRLISGQLSVPAAERELKEAA